MSNIYHQELLQDPSVLLRMGKLQPVTENNPLTALDAKVAAVSGSHPYIVTSANSDYIPAPPFGNTISVHMREDYRYGPEDHTQWPQVYLSEFGYHVCIEKRDLDGPFAGLWATPSKDTDFHIDRNIAHGIGLLSSHFFLPVQMAVQDACDDHLDYAALRTDSVINRQRAVLTQFELNLQQTRLPFHRALLILRLYQRTALELRAYQVYMKDVKPYLSGEVKTPSRPLSVKAHWMGAFTYNSAVAHTLFVIGCPVWVIREAKLGRSFRCLNVVRLSEPGESGIILHEHGHGVRRLPVLFDGSPVDRDKYYRMQTWTSSHAVDFENPYIHSYSSVQRPTGPLPLPSTSSRPVQLGRPASRGHARKGIAAPYKKTNVFRQSYHQLLPCPLPSWVQALEATAEDFSKCCVETVGGYFVPRPETFVSGENDAKRGTFVRSWLRLRPIVISSYAGPDVLPVWRRRTLSHQAWRTWLLEESLDPAPVRAHPNTSNGKKEGRLRDEIAAKVAELRADDPEVNIIPRTQAPVWHDESFINDPSHHVEACREILWDVAEIGFRLDLMRLDGLLSKLGSSPEHHRRLQECFRSGGRPLINVDLGMANTGLAELDWMSRAPFVWAFKRLMAGWTGETHHSVHAPCPELGYNQEEFATLEFELAQYYIETFFAHFRRSPTIPLQLPHAPKPMRVHFTPPEIEQRPPRAPGYWKPVRP